MTDDEKIQQFERLLTTTFDKPKDNLTANEKELSQIFFTESIISNGGLTAFFEHSDPQDRQEIYQLYQKLGANRSLAILQKFQNILDKLPNDVTISDLLEIDEIDELDKQYWEDRDNISLLGYNYYFNND